MYASKFWSFSKTVLLRNLGRNKKKRWSNHQKDIINLLTDVHIYYNEDKWSLASIFGYHRILNKFIFHLVWLLQI